MQLLWILLLTFCCWTGFNLFCMMRQYCALAYGSYLLDWITGAVCFCIWTFPGTVFWHKNLLMLSVLVLTQAIQKTLFQVWRVPVSCSDFVMIVWAFCCLRCFVASWAGTVVCRTFPQLDTKPAGVELLKVLSCFRSWCMKVMVFWVPCTLEVANCVCW